MKIKKIIAASAAVVVLTVFQGYAAVLLVEDFNMTRFVSPAGNPHNYWTVNPGDPTSGVKPSFVQVGDGHALKLLYSVDSASSFIFDPTYILDYSEFHSLGIADEIPHVAPCGYYFLLDEADLRRYNYLVFSVKGEDSSGFTRRFHVELKTKDRTSSYIYDGVTSRWQKVAIPLSVFGEINNWSQVEELNIAFDESVTAEAGTLYFNNIYFASSPGEVAGTYSEPEKPEKPEVLSDYRVHSLVHVGLNYRYTPEYENEMFSSGELVFQGVTEGLIGRIRARAENMEFGKSFYREELDDYPYYETNRKNPDLSFPTLQLKISGLAPLASRVTAGDLFLGYSPYIFQPVWGWKGLRVDGGVGSYDHSTFLIKKHQNSFSAGSRNLYYAGNHRLRLIGVYDYETAKMGSGTDELDIRKVSDELSYLASALLRFDHRRVNIETTFGDYNYQRHATTDGDSDPWDVEYNDSVDESLVKDQMYKVDMFLDGLPYRGSKFLLSYREIGTDFMPAYRQEPGVFEAVQGDQKGYLLRAQQWYGNYGANLWLDRATRISDSDYGTDVINYGLAYRGSNALEVGLNLEHKTENYKLKRTGDKFPRERDIEYDTEIDSIILETSYNFIHDLEPGMRFPLSAELMFREDRVKDRLENSKDTVHSMKVALDYQMRTDFGISAVYTASTENNTAIYTDNSFNLYVNGTF